MSPFITDLTQLPTTADVVIIGGGPAGAAAVWALHRSAPDLRILLLEQSERLGAGSSLASLENFRTCWPALCLARQMARSVEVFLNADTYLGEGAAQALAVKKRGYLFCAFNERQANLLESDVRRLHEIGLKHIEYLGADEIRYRFGWVGARVIAAKYDPVAGWLDSNALIYRYIQSAPKANILLGASDVEPVLDGQRAVGVRVAGGFTAAPAVVLAAGANSVTLAKNAGLHLPVVLRPRQSFTTGWRHENFPEDAPMIIGSAPYPHVRPEARSGAIFGWEYAWRSKHSSEQEGSTRSADALTIPVYPLEVLKDPRFPSLTLALLARQFGHAEGEGFADPRYLRGLHHNIGYYVYRGPAAAFRIGERGVRQPYDSERALIDAFPGADGLFVSAAHVGHGIMSSPCAGEILACKVLGQPLPDPVFAEFGFDTPWVEYDEGVL